MIPSWSAAARGDSTCEWRGAGLPPSESCAPAPLSPLARRRPLLRLPPRDENVVAGWFPLISGVVRSLASEAAPAMSSATSAAARGDAGGE